MKKRYIIFLAVIVIAFSGCRKNENNTVELSSGSENILIEQPKAHNIFNNNFLYPDMSVYNENGAYLPIYNGNDGSYTIDYLDFATKQSIILCNNLSCKHNNSECNAYISPNVGGVDLEIVSDKLVILSKGNTINNAPNITVMELNGENSNIIGKFQSKDRIKPPYICADDSIYFILERADTDKQGKVVIDNCLVEVDLTTGEIRDIKKVSENTFLRGVVDNNFLIKTITGKVHSIYLMDQLGEEGSEIYQYNQGDEYEFEANGSIYLIDYVNDVIKRIGDNNKIEQVNSFNFTGSPSNTFLRIIDKDNIVVDNTVFDQATNDTVTTRYSIPLSNNSVKEITMNYTFDGRMRPMFVFGTTSKYAFGIVGYEKQKAYGTNQDEQIFEYEIDVPTYGLFDKNNYFNNEKVYETINYID